MFHNNKKRLRSHSEEQTPLHTLQVEQYGAEAESQKHLHTQKQRRTHLCCNYLISLNRHQSSQQTFCHLGLINERERGTETKAVQLSSVKPFICTTLLHVEGRQRQRERLSSSAPERAHVKRAFHRSRDPSSALSGPCEHPLLQSQTLCVITFHGDDSTLLKQE